MAKQKTLPDIMVGEAINAGLNLSQYIGVWEISEPHFLTLYDKVARGDLALHVRAHAEEDHKAVAKTVIAAESQSAEKSIVVVHMRGVLTKSGSSMSVAGSTVFLRREIRAAAADPGVGAIILAIDSPGGTVAGIDELTQEIARAAAQKPVWAFVEDLCASAAYRAASQATRIAANNSTAMVGSIGTYVAMYDYSAKAEKEGIKPVVIKAGKHKGAGIEGTKITDEQVAKWQTIVDLMQEGFTEAVAKGRKLPLARAQELADGDIHQAKDALSLGLIDGIETWETFVASLQNSLNAKQKQKGRAMSTEQENTPQAATIVQLEKAIPGANADFYLTQLKAGATIEQAKDAWIGEQSRRLAAAEERAKAAEEKATKASEQKEHGGNKPLGTRKAGESSEEFADPAAEFAAAVDAKLKRGMSRAAAIMAVNRENPRLREAVVQAANVGR